MRYAVALSTCAAWPALGHLGWSRSPAAADGACGAARAARAARAGAGGGEAQCAGEPGAGELGARAAIEVPARLLNSLRRGPWRPPRADRGVDAAAAALAPTLRGVLSAAARRESMPRLRLPVLRAGEQVAGAPRASLEKVALHNGGGAGLDRAVLPLDKEYFIRLGGKEKLVIVSWTTGAPSPGEKGSRTAIAVNLALSIRKYAPQLERRFAYISLDDEAHQVMKEQGFNSALCRAGECRSTDIKDDIWKLRWYLMLTLTGFGLSALVVDADIVFLNDPIKHLWFDSDLEVMTDHFFPERHLWEPWVRVEDHINTGFVLARPSLALRDLLVDFLDAHWEREHGGVMRDGMDQRVFNHFVVRRMSADVPTVYGRYENLTFGRVEQIVPRAALRQVGIRILDPKQISHGMNFFWRRAHLLAEGATRSSLPAVAHVNGADPKEYFLRDRGVWFVDDWFERFGDAPRFITYVHPRGLSLKEDFAHLAAGVEVAKLLGRRLVLPATMNCRNSPAYHAWGLNITVQGEGEQGNCTFDYFSWAKHLLQVHGENVVEAGLRFHEIYQSLAEEASFELPFVSAWLSLVGGGEGLEALIPRGAAVVDVRENIVQVRSSLRQRLNLREPDSYKCIFQQFPHQVQVCRDDRYVGRFGKEAQCDAYDGQASCGLDGFTCCMAFWGYSEKLEIFTGARWDLPCSCGLGEECLLTRVHEIEKEDQQYDRHCCAHARQEPPQEQCMLVPKQRNMTIYGDSHFYSSYLMADFLDKKIDPQRAFERCKEHRAGTLLDTDPARAQLHCNHMLLGIALWHGRFDRAFRWLEYMHWDRRKINSDVAPLSTETGRDEGGVPDEWKARHDLDQLRYLAKRPSRQQVTPYAPLALPDFAARLAEAYSQLSSAVTTHSGAQVTLDPEFSALRPYLDRAVHVPHVERREGGATSARASWAAAAEAFEREGVASVDAALQPEALQALYEYFLETTVWYGPSRDGGSYVKAQLRDGLHAELLFQVAAEVLARLPAALGSLHLTDVFAHKYDAEWPGGARGIHTFAAASSVAVALWTTPAMANLDGAGNGFEVLAPLPSDGALPSPGSPGSVRLPYRQNRLVFLRAGRPVSVDWNARRWRAGYKHRRVDLWMLFGAPAR